MMALNDGRVGRFRRPAHLSLCLAIALGASIVATEANAASPTSEAHNETIDAFYAARGGRPLWFDERGGSGVRTLLDMLGSAATDGLDPAAYRSSDLDRALGDSERGDFDAMVHADRLLSEAFMHYVRDLRRTPRVDMVWVDPELRPSVQSPRQLLDDAAKAPSIEIYVGEMRWMNPLYAGLRRAIVSHSANNGDQAELLRLNLERARALPAASGRYVIVNASAAQLTMYDGVQAVDSMRVVVGKPIYPTPMMAALIRFTSLNPYWNVPPDLAAERVAPNVLKDGKAYLKAKGYQVLSSWDDNATVVDADNVDWQAVADRKVEVRIRQLPGPANAMGKMKFMFPNAQGIYLHDTPDKKLLGEESRMFSGGCVRLEDAPRLARWLYDGHAPSTKALTPEQRVDLPLPVPVFLTYLTAVPGEDGGVVYLPDVYNRDRIALAALAPERKVASR